MNDEYVPTIGLEIHAELKTQTKMFCRSKNDPDETRPNVNVCPVCLAHPGTLPVINKEAVRSVLRIGTALGSTLADYTEFDRKNYFYPDLPKGYQISQFKYPLVSGGVLNGVPLTRIHLEEDTASSVHDEDTGETLVDYNRSGVPLMELVTEPAMHSASEASSFARELQLLLRYLGISDANMEKGEMRVEANVSVARPGERATAYVEIKNLNSFRAMEKAVEHEIRRQVELIRGGGKVVKQTLGWNETTGKTFAQRTKEVAADYRYFPDPDLPSMHISAEPEFAHAVLNESLPVLPWQRRSQYLAMGVRSEDAQMYVEDDALGDFFDAVMHRIPAHNAPLVSNYVANDLASMRSAVSRDAESNAISGISADKFAELIELLVSDKVTSRSAKEILVHLRDSDDGPAQLAERLGLFKVSDTTTLMPLLEKVVQDNGAAVSDFKAGKEASLKFLIGQAMRVTKGAGSPEAIREMLIKLIG